MADNKLTAGQIDGLFERLNEILEKENQHGRVLMVGGAVLTTVYQARTSTQDIDAMFRPSVEMRKAISIVAEETGLGEDWLNDGVKGFMTPQMQTETTVYKEYSNLIVDSLNPEPLLAMKLSSARMGTQDLSDSLVLMKALNIQSLEKCFEILEKYIEPARLTPKVSFFTEVVFDSHAKMMAREQSGVEKAPASKEPDLEL